MALACWLGMARVFWAVSCLCWLAGAWHVLLGCDVRLPVGCGVRVVVARGVARNVGLVGVGLWPVTLMCLLAGENMCSLAGGLALPCCIAVRGPGSSRAVGVASWLLLAPCGPFGQGMAMLVSPAGLQ